MKKRVIEQFRDTVDVLKQKGCFVSMAVAAFSTAYGIAEDQSILTSAHVQNGWMGFQTGVAIGVSEETESGTFKLYEDQRKNSNKPIYTQNLNKLLDRWEPVATLHSESGLMIHGRVDRNKKKCDACDGKGKYVGFTTVEDPCRQCNGFGYLIS